VIEKRPLKRSRARYAPHSRSFAPFTPLVLLLMFSLLGCSGITHSSIDSNNNQRSDTANNTNTSASTMEESKTLAGGSTDPRLVTANTTFGFKLFHEVAKAGAGKNVFISPSSVALCLAMTYNGAVGETKQGMERALETRGLTHAELNRAYSQLRTELENPDPKVQLQIANSLWARKGVSFNPEFISRNKEFYAAEVTDLDFADPGAPATINEWVRNKTKNKIEKIVDSIDAQSVLFLINAIYFKGAWASEFDKAKTREGQFTIGSGSQKRLPMMNQSGRYNYFEGEKFQAVSLPYGGGRVSMYVFLPSAGTGIDQFIGSLSASNWDSWMKQFSKTQGEISLPRFKVEYEIALNDALKALGMGVAFDPDRADFTGMFQGAQNAFISKVKHKTFAEVNEEGTEAAAVTSTEMVATSVQIPRKSFRMVVDHPFFFAIRDNKTGSVLFLGSITEPM
ncbi:MAG TPA: serpin family protein, partial [Blastocatellia bacterium]|nr:serpin family protein [Blastocatellia bacterium]